MSRKDAMYFARQAERRARHDPSAGGVRREPEVSTDNAQALINALERIKSLTTQLAEAQAENERLRELHNRNVHEDSSRRLIRSSHFCEWRTSFEAVVERSKAALEK